MYKPLTLSLAILSALLGSTSTFAEEFKVLKQISNQPGLLTQGKYKDQYYIPSTLKLFNGVICLIKILDQF